MKYFFLFNYLMSLSIRQKVYSINCSWKGHCLGSKCINENDCSDSLICNIGRCDFINIINKPTKTPVKKTPVKKPQVKKTPVKKTPVKSVIPITSGNSGVITYFTDTVFNCISGQPTGNALAINPLLLGFTEIEWTNVYKNMESNKIPWCGRSLTVTVNGESFTGIIIDTCNPVNGGSFADPNTGEIIGGKCDYTQSIDLYGQPGLDFLNKITNGDDFYNGALTWKLN